MGREFEYVDMYIICIKYIYLYGVEIFFFFRLVCIMNKVLKKF